MCRTAYTVAKFYGNGPTPRLCSCVSQSYAVVCYSMTPTGTVSTAGRIGRGHGEPAVTGRPAAMLEDVLGASRYGVLAVVAVLVVLGLLALVALLRCKREDIPKIVEALGLWWRRR